MGALACVVWASWMARPVGGRSEPSRSSYHPSRATVAPRAKASIVGGTGASIASFPFQVALYDPHAGSPAAGFFCGGVILDATHVVTAAHCIAGGGGRQAGSPGDVEVLAGSTTLDPPDPGSVRDPVQSSAFDSHYNPISSDYDVALLTLARPLWSGSSAPSPNGVDTIAPLALDEGHAFAYANPNDTPAILATASGWGDVNPAPGHGASYPTSLRSVQLPLVSDSLCEEQYAAIEQAITSRMICAGGGRSHVDTCYGDSGGPLVVDRDTPARPPADYVLAGLVDFGNGCSQPGYAGVYTRIASPEIVRFLNSGIGHRVKPIGSQARHRHRHRKRHRHRGARAVAAPTPAQGPLAGRL
jgi:secreted trypsin-like serine protease